MKLHLDTVRMLDRWRLHFAHQPPVSDGVFRRNDGIDTDAIFTSEMNRWYHRLLLEAPEHQLCVHDMAESFTIPESEDGATVLSLPFDIVRIVEVRLSSWRRSARIVTSPYHILAVRQLHPYTRAGVSAPVAVFENGRLSLYPAASPADVLSVLRCVCFRDGEYDFDDSALSCVSRDVDID